MEKKIVPIVVGLLIFALGWKFGYELERAKFPDITERVDTTYIRDTIVRDSLVPVEVTKWKTIPEYFAVHDTTFMVDSILVDVPMERKVYQEDSLYYAVVTGYHPSLDTLKVYKETVMVETTRNIVEHKPYKWSIGPFVSQEVGLGDYYVAKAGIAGDFGFKHDRWRFQPEIGHYFMPEGKHDWYAGAKLKFDIIRKK